MPIPIKEIKLHKLQMELKNPFTTSFGTFKEREFFITEVIDDAGNSGFGESVSFTSPWYNEETVYTTLHMIEDFLITTLREHEIHHPDDVSNVFSPFKRNHMAKAAV